MLPSFRNLINGFGMNLAVMAPSTNTSQQYNHNFFADQFAASSRSAAIIVPLVTRLLNPGTVIDVGCGIGCWAAQFLENGARVTGVDGNWVDPAMLEIPAASFVPHDLRAELRLEQTFDLAVCIEVGEHLPESRASSLIDDLVRLAPCVLFSAAVPGQGGADHINEQPLSYWVRRFEECGYQPVDYLRPIIWNDEGIAWWFRQNVVLFCKPGHPVLSKGNRQTLDLYHPNFVSSLRQRASQPGLRICLKALPAAILRAVKARLRFS